MFSQYLYNWLITLSSHTGRKFVAQGHNGVYQSKVGHSTTGTTTKQAEDGVTTSCRHLIHSGESGPSESWWSSMGYLVVAAQ